MPEGAYSESLVVHVDTEGEREVIGFAPGPAGVAEIDLGPGTTLAVDFADLGTLCSIRTSRAADPSLLAALIGDEATSAVMSARPSSRPHRIPPRGSRRGRGLSDRFRKERQPQGLGDAAVLGSLADDHHRHEFARGVAALELGQQARVLPIPDQAIEWIIRESESRAVELLDRGLDALELAGTMGPEALEAIARMLRHVSTDSPAVLQARALEREVSAAAKHIRLPIRASAPARASAPPAAMHEPSPLPVGHFLHRAADKTVGDWVRLVDESLGLVSLAPVLHMRGEPVADLLASPELDWSSLTPMLTVQPLPAAGAVNAVRQAVTLGRRAVEMEVLRDPSLHAAWRACARAWEEIGDVRRSQLATRRAETAHASRRASLSERVAASLPAA